MFVGEKIAKLDDKGRVVFPFQLLRQVDETKQQEAFVIKKDLFDKCLALYTTEEWDKQVKKLTKNLNPFNRKHDQFLKEYFRGTAEVFLDKNNRILLSKSLLEFIGGGKEVVFQPQPDRILIWSKENYDKKERTETERSELADEIFGDNFMFNE
jgi:MraZ protein